MTETCRSCGAPIRWGVVQESRKPIPLDPDPADDGNLVLVRVAFDQHGKRIPIVRPLAVDEEDPPPSSIYRTHFASCPNAASHRRRR